MSGRTNAWNLLRNALENGDIDENLYYEHVKRNDKFISCQKMCYREEQRIKIHLNAMTALGESESTEWWWRKELARRAHERSIKWGRLTRETRE